MRVLGIRKHDEERAQYIARESERRPGANVWEIATRILPWHRRIRQAVHLNRQMVPEYAQDVTRTHRTTDSGYPEDPQATEAGGVRTVNRAVEILELLDEHRSHITVRDIVQRTGLAKTTATRLAHTLVQTGLLWVTEAGYMAGPGLWRWAHLAQRAWELPPEIRRLMDDLASEYQETVNLYVARGVNRLCIAQAESPRPLRHVVNVGDEFPMWTGASGKVLLAEVDDQTFRRVVDSIPEDGPDALRLRAEVATVRRDGFSASHGEREEGVSAVGVPIRDESNRAILALGLSGASVRFTDDRVAQFAQALRQAADALSTRNLAWIVKGVRS